MAAAVAWRETEPPVTACFPAGDPGQNSVHLPLLPCCAPVISWLNVRSVGGEVRPGRFPGRLSDARLADVGLADTREANGGRGRGRVSNGGDGVVWNSGVQLEPLLCPPSHTHKKERKEKRE
jgi:hypothetical protein